MSKTEDIVNHISKAFPNDIRGGLKYAENMRMGLHRTSALSDKKDMKYLGGIPLILCQAIEKRFGKECWHNEKFTFSFFKAYKRFQIADRI